MFRDQNLLDLLDHLPSHRAMRFTTNTQKVIRLLNLYLFKKHIAHIGIVMLACMYNHFLDVSPRLLLTKNLTIDRTSLNKLRTCAQNGDYFQANRPLYNFSNFCSSITQLYFSSTANRPFLPIFSASSGYSSKY